MRTNARKRMQAIEKALQEIENRKGKTDLAKRIEEVAEYIKQGDHEPLTEAERMDIAKALAKATGRPQSDFL